MVGDESTHHKKIQTGKRVYKQGTDNIKKITKDKFKVNIFGAVGINCNSYAFIIKNLTEISFSKVLINLRQFFSYDKTNIFKLEDVIKDYSPSKKEIREYISNNSTSNEEFTALIERSMKSNKKDDVASLARKLGKHCKRESTENPEKIKETKKNIIIDLLNHNNLIENLKNERRIVMMLDNVNAHTSDFVLKIAEMLNIQLFNQPKYSPDLNPTEETWDYSKYHLKKIDIPTQEVLQQKSLEFFYKASERPTLTTWYKETFLPHII